MLDNNLMFLSANVKIEHKMNIPISSKCALIYVTISKELLRDISIPLAVIFLRTYGIVNICSLFLSFVKGDFLLERK